MWLEGTYTSATNYNTSARLMKLDSMLTPDVSIDRDLFFYNGSVQKPVVTVVGLTEGTDYDIVWSDPESKEVGKYELWIQFKGDYAEQSEIGMPYDIIEDPYQLELEAPQPARTWGDFEPVGGFCPNTIATVRATAPYGTDAWVGIYQASDTEYRRDNCFAWASAKAYSLEDEDALLDLSNPAEGEVYNNGFLGGGCYKAVLFEDGTYAKPHAEVIFFILGRHTYEAENTTYTWAEGYASATAKVTCTFCDSFEEETATATSAVTTEPTCTEPGVRTYTADFEADRFETQTTTEAIEAIGHDYEIAYDWAEDGSKCTATATCKNDATHVVTEEAATTGTVKTPAACETKGTTTYTASFTKEPFETQTKDIEDIDALGHDWGEWTEAEPSTCIKQGQLVRECKRDPEHKEYKDAELAAHKLKKTDAKDATCTEAGNIEFWQCTVCNKLFKDGEGLNEIAEADTVVAALGHDYQVDETSAIPATATEDGKEADQKCSRCGDVIPGAVIPKTGPSEEEKAIADAIDAADAQANDASGKADAAVNSTDENVVSDAENSAAKAAELAAVAEAQAEAAFNKAEAAFIKALDSNDEVQKEIAKNNLDVATENLAAAKVIKAAANSSLAKAKQAAANIAAGKAAAASAAAEKAADPTAAEELRKEAEAQAAIAAEKAASAETAAAVSGKAVAELGDLAEKVQDPAVKEAVKKEQAAAEKSAGAASESAKAAETSSEEAKASETKAEEAVQEIKRQGVLDKKIPKMTIKSKTSKKTSITIKWKWTSSGKKKLKKSKATKYEIWVCPNTKFAKEDTIIKTCSKSKTSYTVKSLKKNKKYYFKIRAIKYVGGVKHVGPWSSRKYIKTKKK